MKIGLPDIPSSASSGLRNCQCQTELRATAQNSKLSNPTPLLLVWQWGAASVALLSSSLACSRISQFGVSGFLWLWRDTIILAALIRNTPLAWMWRLQVNQAIFLLFFFLDLQQRCENTSLSQPLNNETEEGSILQNHNCLDRSYCKEPVLLENWVGAESRHHIETQCGFGHRKPTLNTILPAQLYR